MCSPRNGPRSAGRSSAVSPSASRSGVRIERTRPSDGMVVLDDRLARRRLRVDERLLDRVDPRGRDTRRDELRDPLVDRPRAERLVELREELVAVLVAGRHRREPLVLVQVGPPDHVAQPLPEDLLRGADDEPAVGGLEVLERHDRRMRRVVPARRHEPVRRGPGADVHQLVQGGLEQRDVAVAPDAVPAGPPDSRQERDRRRVAAREVDEREPALRRRRRPARP